METIILVIAIVVLSAILGYLLTGHFGKIIEKRVIARLTPPRHVMKLMVGVNKRSVIGDDGQVPWRCKDDMIHFKEMTMGGKLLIGRKTFESLPQGGLPGRQIIVVGEKHSSLKYALSLKPDWVIGGAEIYDQVVHLCDEIYISHINDNSEGDTHWKIPEDYKGHIHHYYFEAADSLLHLQMHN